MFLFHGFLYYVDIHVSEKCGLQCGNHSKADKACSKCVCKQPWIGEKCGMYVSIITVDLASM